LFSLEERKYENKFTIFIGNDRDVKYTNFNIIILLIEVFVSDAVE